MVLGHLLFIHRHNKWTFLLPTNYKLVSIFIDGNRSESDHLQVTCDHLPAIKVSSDIAFSLHFWYEWFIGLFINDSRQMVKSDVRHGGGKRLDISFLFYAFRNTYSSVGKKKKICLNFSANYIQRSMFH